MVTSRVISEGRRDEKDIVGHYSRFAEVRVLFSSNIAIF